MRGHFTYEVMIWHLNVKDTALLHVGKSIPGKGNSRCRGPEAGESFACVEKMWLLQGKPGRRDGDEDGEPEATLGHWEPGGHCTKKWKDAGMSSET